VIEPGGIFRRCLELTGKQRPRVLFIMTASGDDATYLSRSYQAISGLGVEAEHLALFSQPTGPVDDVVARADLIWVGGGSVANLLSLWRLHGVDRAVAAAHERGAVLGGVSAGSICWHVGGPTDSFGPTLQVVTDGLGLVPFGNGVHYDSEAQRRPLLHDVVGRGILPTSFATDDGAAVIYREREPVEVVLDSPGSLARAYRVEQQGNGVTETVLEPGPI
jgi:peptidase E